jgi:hypothetical protein
VEASATCQCTQQQQQQQQRRARLQLLLRTLVGRALAALQLLSLLPLLVPTRLSAALQQWLATLLLLLAVMVLVLGDLGHMCMALLAWT